MVKSSADAVLVEDAGHRDLGARARPGRPRRPRRCRGRGPRRARCRGSRRSGRGPGAGTGRPARGGGPRACRARRPPRRGRAGRVGGPRGRRPVGAGLTGPPGPPMNTGWAMSTWLGLTRRPWSGQLGGGAVDIVVGVEREADHPGGRAAAVDGVAAFGEVALDLVGMDPGRRGDGRAGAGTRAPSVPAATHIGPLEDGPAAGGRDAHGGSLGRYGRLSRPASGQFATVVAGSQLNACAA